jgi:hypothetical protein
LKNYSIAPSLSGCKHFWHIRSLFKKALGATWRLPISLSPPVSA